MDELTLRVRQLVESIEAFRRSAAEVLGVGFTGTNALAELWFHGPQTPTSLAERVGLTSPSVTALVDRLEAAGMVARQRNPVDRRSVVVELTGAGTGVMKTIVGLVGDHIAAGVAAEPPELVGELRRMLDQITVSVRDAAADRAGIAAALEPPVTPSGTPSVDASAMPSMEAPGTPSIAPPVARGGQDPIPPVDLHPSAD